MNLRSVARFLRPSRTIGLVQYLGDAWFQAADSAIQAAAGSAPPGRVVVDQTITDRDLTYRITISGTSSALTLHPKDDGEASARFEQTEAVAIAIARGHTDAHQAFLLGQLRFHGDIGVLIEQRASFDWLQETLAPVLANTTF